MVRVRYLGHAAVYLEGENLKALVDPFLSGNPQASSSPGDFRELSHIFVTHGHGDHLGDAVEMAKRTGAILVSNFELCALLEREGIATHPMHIGGTFRFPFGKVKMTPALHGSGVVIDNQLLYGGVAAGFLIEVEGKKIYHAGDTGLTLDMQLLREEKIDLAFLPIGGNFVMDVDDAVRAVDFIRPRKVVPIHYDTFPLIQASPEEFAQKVGDAAETVLLGFGETLDL
ncbi:MAG TPA: metal-dependent hydrolase [Synergistaceae bacterium]|nr:metal-dependent hydrolase [Synergistaceae bacterium]HPJ24564.1 metal-dependent hydrolase [Synergistaceae bacterium]HPQ36321.1 metal-dependent hydrolase [Synergistaceae bacterium]